MSESTVINNAVPFSPYTMQGLHDEATSAARGAATHLNYGLVDLAQMRAEHFKELNDAWRARFKAERVGRR